VDAPSDPTNGTQQGHFEPYQKRSGDATSLAPTDARTAWEPALRG
jgi:hypothetical protein